MGRPKPVALATQTFKSQKFARHFYQKMLRSYQRGARVRDEDACHLKALLELHTEYAEKVGCGISHFEVMISEHGTPCFRIIRKDGSGTDFSYRHCIEPPPSRKREVIQAFRLAVRPVIISWRKAYIAAHAGADGLVACTLSGERVAPEMGQIDHCWPETFDVLVREFLAGQGISYEDVPLTPGQDNQVHYQITSSGLVEEFLTFHNRRAKLRFVKAILNLEQGNRPSRGGSSL